MNASTISAILAALARHQHKITDSHGVDLCAGCLEDWPCPDLDLRDSGGQS